MIYHCCNSEHGVREWLKKHILGPEDLLWHADQLWFSYAAFLLTLFFLPRYLAPPYLIRAVIDLIDQAERRRSKLYVNNPALRGKEKEDDTLRTKINMDYTVTESREEEDAHLFQSSVFDMCQKIWSDYQHFTFLLLDNVMGLPEPRAGTFGHYQRRGAHIFY